MRKKWLIASIAVLTVLFGLSTANAATLRNITSRLGGAVGDIFQLDGTLQVFSLKVGSQGAAGTAFLNGSIINNTTNDDGDDNPVTIADNLRVDGKVYRGEVPGIDDDSPFVINDDVQILGDLTVNGMGNMTRDNFGKILGKKASQWQGNVYRVENDVTLKKSEKVTVTFTPQSATTGTWSSSPLNPFCSLFHVAVEEGGAGEHDCWDTEDEAVPHSGSYTIVGSTLYVLNDQESENDVRIMRSGRLTVKSNTIHYAQDAANPTLSFILTRKVE